MSDERVLLSVNNIEVIYNHVVLVLKGVSIEVTAGDIVALLGGNGAGKTTTSKAISNLLRAERGEVTKGSITFDGQPIDALGAASVVRHGLNPGYGGTPLLRPPHRRGKFTDRGVYKGRRTGPNRRGPGQSLRLFPEAQNPAQGDCRIHLGRRAADDGDRPRINVAAQDDPALGLAPQLVEEIFAIVHRLNTEENVGFLVAEQNTNIALRYADYG
jgi:branched-chain amino acid transport system ATP-binding protein